MTKIVATGTLKGGTGKTMSLFNLAGSLAQSHRVLLIDCDPQCNLTSNTGVDISDPDQPSIRNIFEDSKTPPETVVWTSVIEALPKLDLIPSSLYLIDTEMNLVSRAGRENLLANWLKKNAAFIEQYDYLLLDTNPSMGLVNQNAFVVANSIILVTDVGFNSLLGTQAFIYLWGKRREDLLLKDNIKALIFNNSDKRTSLSAQLKEYIEADDELSKLLVLPEIPARVSMKRTEGLYLPITISEPKSDSAKAVDTLVHNLKKRGAL
jgi:chromosome partitioning protein